MVPRVPADLHAARGRASPATSSSTTSSSAGPRTRPSWQPAAPPAGSSRFVVEPDPDDPADVIGDEPIWHDGAVVGWVTSGGYGHHVKQSIALGYVPTALATPDGPGGDGFEIEIIGRRRPARLQPEPLFDPRAPGCASDRGASPSRRGRAGGSSSTGGRSRSRPGDSVAVAILRAGEVPGRGGTLCLAGDCGNCLAEVDGVAYVRTCQTAARPGMAVVAAPGRREAATPRGRRRRT